ncbi:MAG TPA: hypothetical protein VMR81_03905 [Patescibacteria group bacterium]|nr:hypothetical protein [Patescibacteria group bacterium]
MKKKSQLDASVTKGDLEDAVAQIASSVTKVIEESEKKLSDKIEESEKKLSDKIDDLGADISDHRRRIRDLETDTITRREFNQLKSKVLPS